MTIMTIMPSNAHGLVLPFVCSDYQPLVRLHWFWWPWHWPISERLISGRL